MAIEFAVDHLLRRLDDGAGAPRIDEFERKVDLGGGAFDDGERADDWPRHALDADAEIPERALRLRAPISVGRHFDRAEGVGLAASLRHGSRGGRVAKRTNDGRRRQKRPAFRYACCAVSPPSSIFFGTGRAALL